MKKEIEYNGYKFKLWKSNRTTWILIGPGVSTCFNLKKDAMNYIRNNF